MAHRSPCCGQRHAYRDRASWFRLVENLGWQFVGCVRNRDFVSADAGESWLLASSLSLEMTPAVQIIAWYRLRMHIEEGFRDLKSTRYGLGFETSLSRNPERLAILLLIAALALLACWLIGLAAMVRGLHYRLLAALNLARAGYKDDARTQFEWLLRNSKDAAQLELARRELEKL